MQAGLTLAIALAAVSAPERVLVDKIVGIVNDDVVLLSELRATAALYLPADATAEKRRQVYEATMENLIADKLMSQQVKEAKISVTESDIDRAVEDILRQNRISKEDLQSAVESRGMTMARYRADLESQIVRLKLVDLKVRSRVVVAEADIEAEYKRQISDEKREELLTLRHLFFRWGESPDPTERKRVLERAKVAQARLLNGEDFATVAKEVSEGPTAAQGGALGELSRTSLLPELAKAAQTLEVMKISDPIDTTNGLHILRIDSIRKTEPPSYEEKKKEIYPKLYQQEVERQMKVWIDELRAQSAVEIRLDGIN